MCMEMMASMAAGQMKKQGQGMPNAQLPNMPGAMQVSAPTFSQLGGNGGTSPLLGLLSQGPKTGDITALDSGNKSEDADMLKKWSELQPSRDIDLMTLLKMMGRQ